MQTHAVAVPAVMAYNWLGRRNKAIQSDLVGFTADLHDSIVTGARVAPPQAAPAAAKK